MTATSTEPAGSPTDIDPNSFAVVENTDTTGGLNLGTLIATDEDAGETFTYSVVGGPDAANFVIGGSGDELIFDEGEGIVPSKIQDKELLEQFEQIAALNPKDKEALKTVIESMIIKNKLQQIMPARKDAAWTEEMRSVVAEFRKGAEDYSDMQIESIVDEAVDAVRRAG